MLLQKGKYTKDKNRDKQTKTRTTWFESQIIKIICGCPGRGGRVDFQSQLVCPQPVCMCANSSKGLSAEDVKREMRTCKFWMQDDRKPNNGIMVTSRGNQRIKERDAGQQLNSYRQSTNPVHRVATSYSLVINSDSIPV